MRRREKFSRPQVPVVPSFVSGISTRPKPRPQIPKRACVSAGEVDRDVPIAICLHDIAPGFRLVEPSARRNGAIHLRRRGCRHIIKQKAPPARTEGASIRLPRVSRHGPIPDPLDTRADDRRGQRGLPIKACPCQPQLSLRGYCNTVRGLDRLIELSRANRLRQCERSIREKRHRAPLWRDRVVFPPRGQLRPTSMFDSLRGMSR